MLKAIFFSKIGPLIRASTDCLPGIFNSVFVCLENVLHIFGGPDHLPGVLKAVFSLDKSHGILLIPLYLQALLYLDQPLEAFLKAPP